MNEKKAVRIASVKYAGDFKLRLHWVNRFVTLVDLSEPIHRLEGLQPLRLVPWAEDLLPRSRDIHQQ